MQVSTIEIRAEGVERSAGAKKDGKEDAGAESAFAAFFAHAQHDVQRKSTAKTGPPDTDKSVEHVDGGDARQTGPAGAASGKQEEVDSEAATAPTAPVQKTEASTTDTEVEGEPATPNSTIVLAADAGRLRSHAKYTVAAPSVKAPEAKVMEGTAQRAEASVPAPVASGVTFVVPAVETLAVPTAAPAAPAAPSRPVSAPSATVVTTSVPLPALLEVEVETKPQLPKTAREAPAVAAGTDEEVAQAAQPEPKVAPASGALEPDSDARDDSGTEAGNELRSKIPVSRATSHAAKPMQTPAKSEVPVEVSALPTASASPKAKPMQTPAKSEVPVEVSALPTASASPKTTVAVTEISVNDSEQAEKSTTTASAATKSAEAAPKPGPQVVRNVTQLVSPDGAVIATQTTEARVEGASVAGQRDVVVVERTTIQALPEQALRGVRFLTSNGEHTMRIRLVPESLGEVRLEVTTARGEVSVKLASASAAVREILQTHAQGLQNAIAQDNSSAVRVTVTSDVTSNAWLSSNAQRQGNQQSAHAQHQPAAATPYHGPKQGPIATTPREAAHVGNLNVYA